MPSSIETSGSADGPSQNVPSRIRSFDSRWSRYVTVYSRRPVPTTRARSTGSSCASAPPVARAGEERADALGLILLNVEQEHVGRVGRHLNRELVEQAGLQRSDPDDEERAEADGQQDDPRLVAGTRQMQHRVTQRERSRVRERRNDRDQRRGPPGTARTRVP